MATSPTPMPDQSAASPSGGGTPPPSQSGGPQGQPQDQASQLQQLFAKWYQTAKQMGASDPRLAEGAELVSQGVQKMQAALVTPPQQTQMSQQPSY